VTLLVSEVPWRESTFRRRFVNAASGCTGQTFRDRALSHPERSLPLALEHSMTDIRVAIAVLAIVGVLAGWLPARRAARIDPSQVLREG